MPAVMGLSTSEKFLVDRLHIMGVEVAELAKLTKRRKTLVQKYVDSDAFGSTYDELITKYTPDEPDAPAPAPEAVKEPVDVDGQPAAEKEWWPDNDIRGKAEITLHKQKGALVLQDSSSLKTKTLKTPDIGRKFTNKIRNIR